MLDAFHTEAAALGTALEEPPTVSFLRLNGDRLRVFGVPSFTGSIAEDAGLPRPDSQRFDETSQDICNEDLDRADGDWLFYGVQGDARKVGEPTGAPLWPTAGSGRRGHRDPRRRRRLLPQHRPDRRRRRCPGGTGTPAAALITG